MLLFGFEKWKRKTISRIDLNNEITIIYPTNTIEDSTCFLDPKYGNIVIEFDGFNINIEESLENGDFIIDGLPKGFIITLKFGLGLEKKYKVILSTLLKHFRKCKKIIISKTKITGIEDNVLIVNNVDFNNICRGIDRNNNLYHSEAMIAKESFVYENLLYNTDSENILN